jgi:hypothetical protein
MDKDNTRSCIFSHTVCIWWGEHQILNSLDTNIQTRCASSKHVDTTLDSITRFKDQIWGLIFPSYPFRRH